MAFFAGLHGTLGPLHHVVALGLLRSIDVHVPEGVTPNLQIFWRWLHIVAAILWIGLLYFFNLVNAPFLRELDPATRARILGPLMWRALNWFRWSSLVTVLAGWAYWGEIVHTDASNAGAHQGPLWTSWLLIWILVWVVFYLSLRMLRSQALIGIVLAIAITAACLLFLRLNSHGWESNRTLSIGLGGGMGFFLLLNVWGIVWRTNKKLIRWTEENLSKGAAMPAHAAELARQSLIASRCSFYVTFPLIFFMAAASHYPLFGA
ncbi:MAG TPA: hypothetical protein VFZ99_02865 [Terriglobales bacterium]